MKNNCYSTEKRLRFRLFLLLSLYTVIGFAVMLLSDYVLALFPLPISTWILSRLDVIFALYLIFGFMGIFCFYWKKPWEYLNEVISATDMSFWTPYIILISAALEIPLFLFLAIRAYCKHRVA